MDGVFEDDVSSSGISSAASSYHCHKLEEWLFSFPLSPSLPPQSIDDNYDYIDNGFDDSDYTTH